MKLRSLLAALALGLAYLTTAFAQDAAPAPSSAQTELQALVQKISAKLGAGQRTADALKAELAEFDALRAKYSDNTEDNARIGIMQAMLYVQVLGDEASGKKILGDVKEKFTGTEAAGHAAKILEMLSPEGKARAAAQHAAAEAEESAKLSAIVGKTAPELNFAWSSSGALKRLSELKGQVVVLDFWATWCGPCIRSFPKVRAEVAHFKDSPVKFIGVTSLQGRVHGIETKPIDTKDNPQKEYDLMPQFMKKQDMTWEVAFSTEEVFNPDYAIRGIPYIAIIAPDGTVRHAGLNPHDPDADIEGKVTAILKEFKLPTPKA